MKSLLRSLFASILAILARGILRKYKPTVVMVTGSVGKTSTKDAVAAALADRAYVRKSEKSYNSEFGVPLTILGAKNPWANPGAWLQVFGEALALRFLPNHYPSLLVLEVGADRPGDLARILRIATPTAVVVTRLPEVPVHVEAYATPAAVREEEFAPAYALDDDMPLIVNTEDEYALAMSTRLPARLVTFGMAKDATVRITHPKVHMTDKKPDGMSATLVINAKEYPLMVPGVVGAPSLYAPAAAVATALALDLTVEEAFRGLSNFTSPAGRARLLKGRNGAVLIDDSYNSSPAAVEQALASLNLIAGELKLRRIAVLGDMLELGRYSHEEHERVGKWAARQCDLLVTVGVRARGIASAAQEAGMKEDAIRIVANSNEATESLMDNIGTRDVLLIKGSQSVRTERIVEALLADPADRSLLVRQDTEWRKR